MLPKVFLGLTFWEEVCRQSHGSCLVVGRVFAPVCGSHCGNVIHNMLIPILRPPTYRHPNAHLAPAPHGKSRAGNLFPMNWEELD